MTDRWHMGLVIVLCGAGAACGRRAEPPTQTRTPPTTTSTPSVFDKQVPVVAPRYLGHPLEHWIAASTSNRAEDRVHAAWALGILAGLPAKRAQAIARLLQDVDANVRFAATVAAAGVAASPQTAAALAQSLSSPSQALRHQARRSLVAAGAAAHDALMSSLEDRSVRARWGALWVLARVNPPPRAVAALERLLRTDPSRDVRTQAALAMGRAGAAGPERLAALLSDPVVALRLLAERGLRNCGVQGVSVLVALLESPNDEHRDFAAGVFAARSDLARLAVGPLRTAARDEGPAALDAAAALQRINETLSPK